MIIFFSKMICCAVFLKHEDLIIRFIVLYYLDKILFAKSKIFILGKYLFFVKLGVLGFKADWCCNFYEKIYLVWLGIFLCRVC